MFKSLAFFHYLAESLSSFPPSPPLSPPPPMIVSFAASSFSSSSAPLWTRGLTTATDLDLSEEGEGNPVNVRAIRGGLH